MTEIDSIGLSAPCEPAAPIRPTRATAPLVSGHVRAGDAEYGISGFELCRRRRPDRHWLERVDPERIFRGELSLDAQRSHPTRRPPHPRMSNS
jgi:hypothetical protein